MTPARATVRRHGRGAAAGILLAAALTTACTSGSAPAPTSGAGSSAAATGASPSSDRPDHYGDDAAALLAKVPGCGGGHTAAPSTALAQAPELSPAASAVSGALGVASCSLRGHTELLFTFAGPAAEKALAAAAAHVDDFLGVGRGWLALPAAVPEYSAQQSSAQEIGVVLGGDVVAGHPSS